MSEGTRDQFYGLKFLLVVALSSPLGWWLWPKLVAPSAWWFLSGVPFAFMSFVSDVMLRASNPSLGFRLRAVAALTLFMPVVLFAGQGIKNALELPGETPLGIAMVLVFALVVAKPPIQRGGR